MEDYKSVLNDLSVVLRHLHKALLDKEAENFGPVSGPYQLLNLVANHEHFAWLRHLSELMVDIDERRDEEEPVDADRAAAFRLAIESLVGPHEVSAPRFRERYTVLLQQSPAAAMAHGDLRRVLDALPEPDKAKLIKAARRNPD
ncbi:MAG TPA: hypothetical protein VFK24_01425 [Gammaproteobacteria bacterium]|nr:hypothetical protein [Gammaproteobacteria bacterium]